MGAADRPAALLRHTDLDGASHFDLLLATTATPAEEERCALCWRCAVAAHALHPGLGASIVPLPLHRGLYLRLDVPRVLEGTRGRVEPIARGRWRPVDSERAELSWTPHGPSWLVRFRSERGILDPRDAASLAGATNLERIS